MRIRIALPLLLLAGAATAGATTYLVQLTTDQLSTSSTYYLDFQLNDGDNVQDNEVDLSDFNFGGFTPVGSPQFNGGGGSGDLVSGFILQDVDFFNQITQGFTPTGTVTLSFLLTYTENFDTSDPSNVPDEFVFTIDTDNSGSPGNSVVSSGQHSLVVVDIQPGAVPVTYPADNQYNNFEATITSIPEPASWGLSAAGLLLGLALRRRRSAGR